ncbi:hypothetical protein ACLBQX_28850, partial [Klebsiella pneumoniae]
WIGLLATPASKLRLPDDNFTVVIVRFLQKPGYLVSIAYNFFTERIIAGSLKQLNFFAFISIG